MKTKVALNKKDFLIVLCCVSLLLVNIGAIGGSSRRRTKEMVCLSNLRQWGMMFEMFTNDNDGYFNRGWDVGETDLWMNALRPYYDDDWNLLLCPEATRVMQSSFDSGVFRAWYRDVDLPTKGSHLYVSSYGINSWTNNMSGDRTWRREEWFWKNVRVVQGRNNVPVFFDSSWHDAWPSYTDSPPEYDGMPVMGGISDMAHFSLNRHNGAVNGLFMDWSARKVGIKQLWTLKWHRGFNTNGPWTKAGGVTMWDWPQWMRNFKEY